MSTTRVTTRSSSTQAVNVAECAERINQLTKRIRHASKTGGAEKESTPAGSESTPTVEDTPSRLPGSSDSITKSLKTKSLMTKSLTTKCLNDKMSKTQKV